LGQRFSKYSQDLFHNMSGEWSIKCFGLCKWKSFKALLFGAIGFRVQCYGLTNHGRWGPKCDWSWVNLESFLIRRFWMLLSTLYSGAVYRIFCQLQNPPSWSQQMTMIHDNHLIALVVPSKIAPLKQLHKMPLTSIFSLNSLGFRSLISNRSHLSFHTIVIGGFLHPKGLKNSLGFLLLYCDWWSTYIRKKALIV
jgi:hypothetical protein